MRNALLEGWGAADGSSHPGLLLERYMKLDTEGKVPDDERKPGLDRVVRVPVPEVYRAAYDCWKQALQNACATTVVVAAKSRLLIGHGNPAPLEVGLTLHRTYGVPVIPGSALKGVLSHYMSRRASPDRDDPSHEWRGTQYNAAGHLVSAPGAYHRALFGAPALPGSMRLEGRADDDGNAGCVVFEDAWYVPDKAAPLLPDVLTPHQQRYYSNLGKEFPIDWDDPNPVQFLTVRPGTRFLIALSHTSPMSKEWAALALRHLLDAVAECGVGGKTSAGYGRLGPP